MSIFEHRGGVTQAVPTADGVVILKPGSKIEIKNAQLTERQHDSLVKNGVKIRAAEAEKTRTDQIAELTALATELGIEVKPQWGVPALQRAIEAKRQEIAEADAREASGEDGDPEGAEGEEDDAGDGEEETEGEQ